MHDIFNKHLFWEMCYCASALIWIIAIKIMTDARHIIMMLLRLIVFFVSNVFTFFCTPLNPQLKP